MGSSVKPVDNLCITRRDHAQKSVDNSIRLTEALPSYAVSGRLWPYSPLRRRVVRAVYCLTAAMLINTMQPAQATTTHIDHYKLYAHSRIVNYEQFICLSRIIYKESRWNVNAKNGSHFGLGQMRSKHYRNLDAYRQIDATIKYITHRYGSMCNAWKFHQKKNYY